MYGSGLHSDGYYDVYGAQSQLQPNHWGLYDMYGKCFFEILHRERLRPTEEKKAPSYLALQGEGLMLVFVCSKNACSFLIFYDIGGGCDVSVRTHISKPGFRVVRDEPRISRETGYEVLIISL